MSHSIFLWPVAICWIASIVITAERIYYLWFRAGADPAAFPGRIEPLVAQGKLTEALAVCAEREGSAIGAVATAALKNADKDRDELELAVEDATLTIGPTLQSRVSYLAMLANVVTLLGLLGTIVGLITSFAAVAGANAETKQTLLAQGISTAMYATAGGIAAAIPTLVAYAVLAHKGNAILDDVERVATRMVMVLVVRSKGRAAAESA